jgi:hypothetical protein
MFVYCLTAEIWHDEQSKGLASDLDVKNTVQRFTNSDTAKVKECATELLSML